MSKASAAHRASVFPPRRQALACARTVAAGMCAAILCAVLGMAAFGPAAAQSDSDPAPAGSATPPARGAEAPAAAGSEGLPAFASPVAYGAWLWEGQCVRCHGGYEEERVGRYVGEDFDEKELSDRIAGISGEGCSVDWAISRGGTLRLEEIKAIVGYVVAWEADPGALELGVLPPQPTPVPTTAAPDEAVPTPQPTATIAPEIAALIGQDPLYEGAWLYAEQCVTCHGDYARARQGSALSLDEVEETIRKGKLGTSMPAFAVTDGGALFGRQISAILTYIEAWETSSGAPALPAALQAHLDARIAVAVPIVTPTSLPPTPGRVERGQVVFQARCAQCHGVRGNGETRVGPALSRLPAGAMQSLIRDTVEQGRAQTIMRAWHGDSGGPLGDQEIDDVLALLTYWTVLPTPAPQPPAEGDGTIGLFGLLLGLLLTIGVVGLAVAYFATAVVPPKAGPDADED